MMSSRQTLSPTFNAVAKLTDAMASFERELERAANAGQTNLADYFAGAMNAMQAAIQIVAREGR